MTYRELADTSRQPTFFMGNKFQRDARMKILPASSKSLNTHFKTAPERAPLGDGNFFCSR